MSSKSDDKTFEFELVYIEAALYKNVLETIIPVCTYS